MSDSMNVDQVLAQMRVLTAQAQGKPAPAEEAGGSFGDMLKHSIDQVNDLQHQSKAAQTQFELGTGDKNLAEVMVMAQKSSLSFQAMVHVRNKLVEAYKDVMNMPV
jgi:flagellar hook-basal body complex protein FliE